MTRNIGRILADAFEDADRINRSFEFLPSDNSTLRCLLNDTVSDANDLRAHLETELAAMSTSRQYKATILLQRELIKTLRLYRFAISVQLAWAERCSAIAAEDDIRFVEAGHKTVCAAKAFLGE